MAFRRSAVRSRLAPPPHRRGRAAGAGAAPLRFLLRAWLALALLGFMPAAAPPHDPALAMARAAGALCLAEGPDGLPSDLVHEHCLACRAAPMPFALAGAPALPVPVMDAVTAPPSLAGPPPAAGRVAYAARAPPGTAG